jgi:predicted nucleic acid-binding protein
MAYYLDTSAAVKLVVAEPDTVALTAWLAGHDRDVVSSDLLRTELLRATRRGAPHAMPRARAVLDSLTLLTMPASTFERAADLDPGLLRSLDALHLAAALELGDDLNALVTYADRLAAAAHFHAMNVIAPVS